VPTKYLLLEGFSDLKRKYLEIIFPKQQSSYSAMLNITESVPYDSRKFLSIPEFSSIPTTSTDSGSSRFPEFRTGIIYTCWGLTVDHTIMYAGEGGDRFRYGILGIGGIGGN